MKAEPEVRLWAADVLRRVEAALGGPLEERARVTMVRDVAPNKRMLCVSFRLPAGVAFAGAPAAPGHAAAHAGAGPRGTAAEGTAPWAAAGVSHAAAHAGPQNAAAEGAALPSAELAGGLHAGAPAVGDEAPAAVAGGAGAAAHAAAAAHGAAAESGAPRLLAGGAHAEASASAAGGTAPDLLARGGHAPAYACEAVNGGAASAGAPLPGLTRPAHVGRAVAAAAWPSSIRQEGTAGSEPVGPPAHAAAEQPTGAEAEGALERCAVTRAGGGKRELHGFELRGPVECARPGGSLLRADSRACGSGQRGDLSWAGQHGVLHV